MNILVANKSAELQSFIDFLLQPATRAILVLSMVVLAIILAPLLKNKKSIIECNKYFFIVGICFIVSEITKQIYVMCVLGYEWWVYFPFQFSALPLFSFIFMPLCKKEFSRNVIKVLTGPFCFYIGVLFWVAPAVINEATSYYTVFQSASWHLAMIFFGLFNTLVYKIYTMKYFKHLLVCTACIVLVVGVGVTLNVIFANLEIQYFYCAPCLPVYPVINLFWPSTDPFVLYACVFIASFCVISMVCFFINVGIGKLCNIIYQVLFKKGN